MLPPHPPAKPKVKTKAAAVPAKIARRTAEASPLARLAFGNIRLRLKQRKASLKPALRIIEQPSE